MTIQLSKEQERFIHDAVRAGLYPSGDAVISDALARLQQTLPKSRAHPAKNQSAARPSHKH